jgi:beta-glucosidase
MAQMKVATLNLFNRLGEWEQRAPLMVEQLVELDPDVIAFQEVDLMLDQGMWIANQVKQRIPNGGHFMRHAASPGRRVSYFGIATLSRLECTSHEVLDLMTFERVAQRMTFRVDGSEFVFVNTHLHHPPEAEAERAEQTRYMLRWLDRDFTGAPTVIAGDFNAYADKPEETVLVMKERFRSAFEAVHGVEPEKTWSTPVNTYDDSPHGTLDYIFVSEQFNIVDAGLAFDIPDKANPDLYPSDHLGLFAVLEL